MNGDHSDALRLYATELLGAHDGEWRCTGCDPEGLDLRLDRTGLRLPFEQPVTTPAALRSTLVKLAEDARGRGG
jgi:heme iron utilization protein